MVWGICRSGSNAPNARPTKSTAATPILLPKIRIRPIQYPIAMTKNSSSSGLASRISIMVAPTREHIRFHLKVEILLGREKHTAKKSGLYNQPDFHHQFTCLCAAKLEPARLQPILPVQCQSNAGCLLERNVYRGQYQRPLNWADSAYTNQPTAPQ